MPSTYTSDPEDAVTLAKQLYGRMKPPPLTIGIDTFRQGTGPRGGLPPFTMVAVAFASDNKSTSSRVPGVVEQIRVEVPFEDTPKTPGRLLQFRGAQPSAQARATGKAVAKLVEALRTILARPDLPATLERT